MSTIPYNATTFNAAPQAAAHGPAKIAERPGAPGAAISRAADEAAELSFSGKYGAEAGSDILGSMLSEALQSIRMMRASMLEDGLALQPENHSFSFSQIRDLGAADEAVNLAKSQILAQPGNAPLLSLAQTNQTDQTFLALIK